MAYWCTNNVLFTGEQEDLINIIGYFEKTQDHFTNTPLHWRQPFIDNLIVGDCSIQYSSRWLPNNQALLQLAEQYHIEFINQYHELNKGIFGECQYFNGRSNDIRLDANDLSIYNYDKEKQIYLFKDFIYDELPRLSELLATKKEKLRNEHLHNYFR